MLPGPRQIRLNTDGKDFSTGDVDSRGGNKSIRSSFRWRGIRYIRVLGDGSTIVVLTKLCCSGTTSMLAFHADSVCTARAGRRKFNESI